MEPREPQGHSFSWSPAEALVRTTLEVNGFPMQRSPISSAAWLFMLSPKRPYNFQLEEIGLVIQSSFNLPRLK